uniref:Cupiennin-6e n=3 Tax=Cupiennius salei TaxID=6928 RepID=TXC6E_CUPSA|nr:RecName: Full=Cupiennin-6e; Short=Cu-6e; AltName: Full=Short cationic peptide-6e; Short=SCP-6e [Cupiennius salei]
FLNPFRWVINKYREWKNKKDS